MEVVLHCATSGTDLISLKASTQYPEFPMPAHYPTFPSRAQMLAHLDDYVNRFGLRERIEFNTEVVSVRPLDRTGLAGWRVTLASGKERDYAGVAVANGHYWDRNIPVYPDTFTGRQLRSKDYKRPADFGEGDRVLVVGVASPPVISRWRRATVRHRGHVDEVGLLAAPPPNAALS